MVVSNYGSNGLGFHVSFTNRWRCRRSDMRFRASDFPERWDDTPIAKKPWAFSTLLILTIHQPIDMLAAHGAVFVCSKTTLGLCINVKVGKLIEIATLAIPLALKITATTFNPYLMRCIEIFGQVQSFFGDN